MAVEVQSGVYMNQIDEVFSHNPLHDLESLWWVGVWFLTCHYHPHKFRDTAVQKHMEVVKTFGETLFNNPFDISSRRRALTSQALLVKIGSKSFPVALQHLIVLLDDFRIELVTYYKRYIPKASQDQSFFNPDLFFRFSDIVEEAMEELRNDQTELWPINLVARNMARFSDK